jgi:NADH:ubiquinone oxidoreductase subunit F (NADH-binding)
MDRAMLTGNPHKILEGLIIGAYAIGSVAAMWLLQRIVAG